MKMRVSYLDGRTVECVPGPRAQVEVERKYDGLFTDFYDEETGRGRVEVFYFTAWAQLHYSGDKTAEADFDDWLNLIEDVEPVVPRKRTKKQTSVPPTRKGR